MTNTTTNPSDKEFIEGELTDQQKANLHVHGVLLILDKIKEDILEALPLEVIQQLNLDKTSSAEDFLAISKAHANKLIAMSLDLNRIENYKNTITTEQPEQPNMPQEQDGTLSETGTPGVKQTPPRN